MDTALKQYPEIVKKYLATVIPIARQQVRRAQLAPCGRAVRSSTFRRASKSKMPLQAYFRINTENMGQFERTLIIADKGSKVHYIEGCTAPEVLDVARCTSAVVELIALEGASIRYTTIQNWYRNIFNLVTKRAVAYKNATVEWVDGNIGSRADDEVPGDLPDGRRRARRDSLGGVRRRGPASGRGREGDPRRAEHHVGRHQQVGLARTAARRRTAVWSRFIPARSARRRA